APRQTAPATIDGIADDRIPDVCKMHTNLMRATGFELHTYERVRAEPLHDPVVRDGLATVRPNGHARAHRAMPSKGLVHRATARHDSRADGEIRAFDFAGRDGGNESRVGFGRPRDDHEPARILVQPMHESGARQGRELRIQREQRVLQRVRRVARTRGYDQAGRLVDDDQRVILVDDRYGERLRLHGGLLLQTRLDPDPLASVDFVPGARDLAVHADRAGLDPALEPRT